MTDSNHIMQLRQQVANLHAELADMYKEKYNLFLTDNEELKRQIDEANAEVEQLRQQRDEARREVCAWQGATSGKSFRDTAVLRGWDCFREPA